MLEFLQQSMNARNRLGIGFSYRHARALMCKRLRSPKESIPPAFVTWRAGATNRVALPGRQAKQAGVIDSWAP